MTPFIALILAGSLWTGRPAPPPDMPDSLITRPLPPRTGAFLSSPRYMVVSAHPLAGKAGVNLMIRGGTAADAALAVQAVLSVVEPESSGPGGGCFILYHDEQGDSLHAIDGREELPAGGHPTMFLDEEGRVLPEVRSGGLPVGVPGTVAAMSRLQAQFGKMPLDSVLAPAIRIAEEGFAVSPDLARAIRSQAPRLLRFPATRELYFRPDGSPHAEGDTLRNPALARFYRLWAASPDADFFYRGEVARAMVDAVRGAPFRPGHLGMDDLANYRAVAREPIIGEYRDLRLAVFPPPTSGGITLLEILGLMETRPSPTRRIREDSDLLDFLDGLARASRTAFADRAAYLGDWDWRPETPLWSLFDPDFIDARALEAFDPDADLGTPPPAGSLEGFDTTHFVVIDRWNNLVCCTSTIEYTFGSGIVVPEYGFLLNNELTDFNLVPSDPPAPNDIEPGRRPRVTSLDADPGEGGKRPRSSMCPVIVYGEDGEPRAISGSVATILLLVYEYDMPLTKAVSHPRLYSRGGPLEIETYGWNRRNLSDSLRTRGWEIAPLGSYPFLRGDVQALQIHDTGSRHGASDPRHDGQPRGG